MGNTFSPNPSAANDMGVDGSNKDNEVQVGALRIDGTLISVTPENLNTAGAAAAINVDTVAVAADDLVIPITDRYVAKTTGVDAEACTLADGATQGQRINVTLVTDGGGDATITPTTASGFVSVVMADAGDTVVFEWVDATVGWIIVGAFGATAQPAINLS